MGPKILSDAIFWISVLLYSSQGCHIWYHNELGDWKKLDVFFFTNDLTQSTVNSIYINFGSCLLCAVDVWVSEIISNDCTVIKYFFYEWYFHHGCQIDAVFLPWCPSFVTCLLIHFGMICWTLPSSMFCVV